MDKQEDNIRQRLQELSDAQQFSFGPADWESASALIDRMRARRRRRVLLYLAALLLLPGLGLLFFGTHEDSIPRSLSVSPPVEAPAVQKEISANDQPMSPVKARTAAQGPVTQPAPGAPAPARPATAPVAPPVEPVQAPVVHATEPDTSPLTVAAGNADTPSEAATPLAAGEPESPAEAVTQLPQEDSQDQEPVFTSSPGVVAAPDTATAALPAPQDSLPAALRQPELLLTVEGGAALNTGWNYGGDREGRGVNPSFGISYYSPVTRNSMISFGVHYNRLAGLGASRFEARTTSYGFGEQSEVTLITLTHLHYVTVPFRYLYALGEKNVLGLAYNASYLLDTYARVESYELRRGTRHNERTYRTGGYTEGVSPFDHQLALLYRRKITKIWQLQGEACFGLSDIKADGFFGKTLRERSTGIRLALVYCIFRR